MNEAVQESELSAMEMLEEIQSESSESEASENPSTEEDNSETSTSNENSDDSEQPEGDSELSLDERLAALDEQKGENEEGSLIDLVNNLGAIRDGQPVEIESEDQIKEALQMYGDYTAKTQQLAEERKTFESEREEFTKQLDEQRAELDQVKQEYHEDHVSAGIMLEIIDQLEKHDPDTFDWIKNEFGQRAKLIQMQENNPAISKLQKEIEELKGNQSKQEEQVIDKEVEAVQSEWKKGQAEAQTELGKKFKQLGVSIVWEDVAKFWSEQDNMTVSQAAKAFYHDKLDKALTAKEKLLKTKESSIKRRGGEEISQKEEKFDADKSYSDLIEDWMS